MKPLFFLMLLSAIALGADVIALYSLEPLGIDSAAAKALEHSLESNLVSLSEGAFQVTTRTTIDDILEESAFQQSGACRDNSCLVEVGQIIGANVIISGSISRLGSTYNLILKQLDVERGIVLNSVERRHKGEIDALYDVAEMALTELITGDTVEDVELSRADSFEKESKYSGKSELSRADAFERYRPVTDTQVIVVQREPQGNSRIELHENSMTDRQRRRENSRMISGFISLGALIAGLLTFRAFINHDL